MSLIPGQVIYNRYRVAALLAQGGMGAVYDAMDLTLNVRCALKEMVPYPGTPGTALPQLRKQFQQEAQLLAELRHPNLPRVTDHFEEDGNAYLVMDFIHGKRLDKIIAQDKKLAEDEVLSWVRQLMEALAYCHEQGVIHRDVKPQNVKITPQGRAMLVDFGLAKLVDPDDPRTRTVMRGLGTPEYAPPEQYDAKKGYTDARTDIYSLGATLYHALTGEAPPTVTERIVDPESLVPLRQLRDDLGEVIEQVLKKAMALQPSQRFQSIAKMHEALFGLPSPQVEAEHVVPGVDTDLLAEQSKQTVWLPRIDVARLRIDRRLLAALVVVSLVSLVTIISLVAGGISAGNAPTATATSTIAVTTTRTMTSTHTPTVTPSSTATSTASPTSRPPTRRATKIPEEFDVPHLRVLGSPTATLVTVTPTYRRVLPTLTHTPVPPTDTPPPPPPPPPTLPPTDTPSPAPTNTPSPPPTNTLPPPTDTPLRPTPTGSPPIATESA